MKPPQNKRKKKKTSPEEDVALWDAVTKTVEPLKNREHPSPEGMIKPRPLASTPVYREAPPPRVLSPLAALSHGHQPGLDKATAKRLRRGRARIEGRLDLHGMTQAQARPALEDFIESAWRADKREVLVITGKGTRSDGSLGILRTQVPVWLNTAPNRARITAFTHAAAKDGGEGALYVRLKKQRRNP